MSAADPITRERVYNALKADYLAGRFQLGARIAIQDIADRHLSSKTPVREAICRLVGEGLAKPDATGGFRIVLASPWELIHLHDWNRHLLFGLVDRIKRSALQQILGSFALVPRADNPLALVNFTGSIFLALARATGNPEALAAIDRINERLLYSRIRELMDFPDAERELRTLVNASVADIHKSIRRRIDTYHERRIGHQRYLIEVREAEGKN